RIVRLLSVVWTFYAHGADMRKVRKARRRPGLNGVAHEVLIEIEHRSEIGLEESHTQHVLAGLRRDPELHSASAEIEATLSALDGSNLTSAAVGCRGTSATLPIEHLEAFAIQQNFQLFAGNGTETGRRHVIAENRRDRQLVLAVRRENVRDEH